MSVAREQPKHKPLVWLHGEIDSPPFSLEARIEAGTLLRMVQSGESLGLPRSRPLPGIASRCHELRVKDRNRAWRIVYRIDEDAILIAEVFPKTTQATPKSVIDVCKARLNEYDRVIREQKQSRPGTNRERKH